MINFVRVIYNIFKHRADFQGVEKYCFFIGYPRSGHTLVRAVLDAHPNIVISNELDAFRFFEKMRFPKRLLFSLILENSYRHAQEKNEWTNYSYAIPSQWQGKFQKLHIIGDKKGGVSTRRLSNNIKLLHRLQKSVDMPIKVIHVIRDPYDNISTIAKRSNRSLAESTEAYFSDVEKVVQLKKIIGDDNLYEMHHEDIITEPKKHITALCEFLGQKTSDAYLESCAGIVYKKPNKSRFTEDWDEDLIQEVKKKISSVNFLERYTHEE